MDDNTAATTKGFFELLQTVSAPVAIVALIIIGVVAYGLYDLARFWLTRQTGLSDVRARIDAMAAALTEHVTNSNSNAGSLAQCLLELRSSSAMQVKTLQSINAQLVLLNAASPDAILDVENARLMVTYQWNWCADVAIRATCSSIENNHFRGNEAAVIARTQRAWAKAAKSAKESLDRLNKFKYPYEGLFTSAIWTVFEQVVQHSIPLYHRTHNQMIHELIDNFAEEARLRFDLMLEAYLRKVEDVDSGELYRDEDGRNNTSQVMTISSLEPLMTRLAQELKLYTPGSGPRPVVRDQTTEIRHLQRQLQDADASQREYPAHDQPRQ